MVRYLVYLSYLRYLGTLKYALYLNVSLKLRFSVSHQQFTPPPFYSTLHRNNTRGTPQTNSRFYVDKFGHVYRLYIFGQYTTNL